MRVRMIVGSVKCLDEIFSQLLVEQSIRVSAAMLREKTAKLIRGIEDERDETPDLALETGYRRSGERRVG